MKVSIIKKDIPIYSTNTEPPMTKIEIEAIGNYYEIEIFYKYITDKINKFKFKKIFK